MNVTIDYIARMANVSKATVSRVINNKDSGVSTETRARVQSVIDEYEYKPNLLARGIVTSKTRTIGLIIPDITNPFFPAMVKAVEAYARANGYTVLLGNTDSSAQKESDCISTMIANRVDGVILASAGEKQDDGHKRLEKYSIPCVLIDRKIKDVDYKAGIFVDNEYALYIAAEYLIKGGNNRIALILGPANLSTSNERLEGYRAALNQYGIPYDADLVEYGAFSFESGYEAVRRLQQKGVEYSAVLAGNDVMALGAIKAFRELDYAVPEDKEIIGFDNILTSDMIDPPLTTIEQPVAMMGRKAAEALVAFIEGKEVQEHNMRLEAKLIIRQSTKPRRQVKSMAQHKSEVRR